MHVFFLSAYILRLAVITIYYRLSRHYLLLTVTAGTLIVMMHASVLFIARENILLGWQYI